LYLDDNLLNGAIPETLASLESMVDLRLGGQEFSGGPIPDFIFGFTNLQILRLHGANFTGAIPTTLSNLADLRQIWLQENTLTGAVPDMSAASELATLRLTGNQFTGQIPAYLETLPKLVDVRLGDNLLTGVIPDFIGNMVQLQLFACQDNQLTGGFPESLTNLVNLGEKSVILVVDVACGSESPSDLLVCETQWFSMLRIMLLAATSRKVLETWLDYVSV
jgi:hypothetical protein